MEGGGLFQADEAGNIEAQLWQEIPTHQPPFRRGQGVPVLEIDVHPGAVRGELQVEMDVRLGKDAGGVDHRQAVPLVGAEEDDVPRAADEGLPLHGIGGAAALAVHQFVIKNHPVGHMAGRIDPGPHGQMDARVTGLPGAY